MLKGVKIFSDCTADECEELINKAIEMHPDDDVNYELLIEGSIRVGDVSEITYTLLINVEDRANE